MALGDDFSEQTGQSGDADDNGARRRMMEFILRSAMKPSIPPMQNGGGLDQPNTKHLRAPGATPTSKAEPEAPYGQTGYTPQASPARPNFPGPRHDVPASSRFQADKNSQTGQEPASFLSATGSGSNADSSNVPSSRFGTSRPRIPSPTQTDAEEPNVSAPFTPPANGKKVLGLGSNSGTPLLGRGSQPTRPDVQPMRSDFPEKPIPTWEKVLGIAAAPFAPAVTGAIFTGPRRVADRQFNQATQDWQKGQEGAERTARIAETNARTRNLLNPPDKQGTTPEETTLDDLMTGNNGGPQINPDTQKPYTRLEAYRTVQGAKAGAAQGAKQPPLGTDAIEQINDLHQQRFQVLNPGKPLPQSFMLKPGATQQDYERIDKNLGSMESAQGTQAQRETANSMRLQALTVAMQNQQDRQDKDAAQQVFAFDPKSKQRVLMSAGDAKAQGIRSYTKVSQPDLEKETSLNSQMNDMQLNTSRYRASLNAMGPLTQKDRDAMTRILSDKSISGYLTNELTLGAMMDQISQGEKGKAWNVLSSDKQDALIGYLRMKNTGLLAQKVLTGMGRASKEALDIELDNMPSPIEGATVGNKKLDAWQDNLDQINSRSVKLPWMETPKDVRTRVEGQATQQYNQRQEGRAPAQPQAAAPKPLKKRLVDFLNQKIGAEWAQ